VRNRSLAAFLLTAACCLAQPPGGGKPARPLRERLLERAQKGDADAQFDLGKTYETGPSICVIADASGAIGLGGVFLHLGAELNFHQMFEAALGDAFSVDQVAQRQAQALAAAGLA
jgi:hypothetical protein